MKEKKTFWGWVNEHKTELVIGAMVGLIGGATVSAICSGTSTPSKPVAPVKETRWGDGIVTDYEWIPEAIAADLAPAIEEQVMDIANDAKTIIERLYDVTEGIDGDAPMTLLKRVTVTIEDVVPD